jgi:predicted TIM-barrel fold metal-dependent hydrolase
MAKIVDVRFRPPLGTFLEMTMFRDKQRTADMTGAMGMQMCPSVQKGSIDLLIAEMERIGSYRCCVSGSKRGIDRAWGWIENDEVAEMVSRYPDRFIGVGAIDATVEKDAIADIDRCIGQYGFKAIVVEPGTHRDPMYADNRKLYPLYERCVELEVPVFILAGGNAGPDMSYSDPIHVEHVAIDLPKLKLVVLHGGWPWVTQILHIAFRRPNIYLTADMYITFPGGVHYIEAINSYLSDRFLYGTSYPFGPVVGYYERFVRLGIREEHLEKVLYRNAQKLLKLT